MGIDLNKVQEPVKPVTGCKPSGLSKLMRLNSPTFKKGSDANSKKSRSNNVSENGLTSDSSCRSLMSDQYLTSSTSFDDLALALDPSTTLLMDGPGGYQHHKHQGSNTTIGPTVTVEADNNHQYVAATKESTDNTNTMGLGLSGSKRRRPSFLNTESFPRECINVNSKVLTFACPRPDREVSNVQVDRPVIRSPFIDKFPKNCMFADDDEADAEDDDNLDDYDNDYDNDYDDEYDHYDEDCDTDSDDDIGLDLSSS